MRRGLRLSSRHPVSNEGESRPGMLDPRFAFVALAVILLVAAFFRLYRLDQVPRGLSHDEANNGLMAVEVTKGYHPVFFEIYTGVEPGLIYPLALAFKLFEPGPIVARLVSVFFGLLTVALTYLFGAHLYRSRLVGLLSALLLAVSLWHVFVSRLVLRAVVMPPLEILTLYSFWLGLEDHRWRHFVLAGFFGGLTMYTYLSSRFLPLVPVAFVLYLLLRRESLRQVWVKLALMGTVWVLVFLPLGIYYFQNPNWFFYRASQALVLSKPAVEGELPPVLSQTLATLGMFTFQGDASWRYNVAGRPVFDWAMGSVFYVGLMLALIRSVRAPKLNPGAFLLIVGVIMLVPGFVTDGSPHFLRTIGALPVIFVFPAVALDSVWQFLRSRWRWVPPVLLGAWLLFAGYSTYHDYFQVWALHPHARQDYNASYAEIVGYLQQHQDQGPAYIASTRPGLDRVSFNMVAGVDPPPAYWFDGSQSLVIPVGDGYQGHYFFPANLDVPEPLKALLPESDAVHVLAPDGSLSFEVLPTAATAVPQQAMDAVLGDLVQVVGYDLLSPTIQAGQPLDLQLHWRVMTNPDPRRQWTWFVHLVDSRGYMWANWSGQGFPVADWQPGDYVVQYAALDVPFDAPDIAYQLQVGIFDENNGERLLTAAGLDHLAIEGIRVAPPDARSVVGIIETHQRGTVGELDLVGAAFGAKQVHPGTDLQLTLAWAPTVTLTKDYIFHLQLTSQDSTWVHEVTWSPLGGEYPTSRWPLGRIVRDVLLLPIPPDAPRGRVVVDVWIVGLEGSITVGKVEILP
jgi:4-amino-4-deoxy-L-arabinose transferase-like glycosyltransferase